MKVIYGPRCSGKTYELMRIAHETDQYIIVPTQREAQQLFKAAKRLDMPIRMPVTVNECMHGNFRGTPYARLHHNGGVLVDETVRILSDILRLPKIQAISVCARDSLALETRLDEQTVARIQTLGAEVDA